MSTFKNLVSEIKLKSNPVEFDISFQMWKKFESNIKIKMPEDYKEFINLFGTGCLGELLWILNPFSKTERFNLISFFEKKKESYLYLEMESNIKFPFPFFKEDKGIFPFAFTDNGDTIYWDIKSKDDHNWTIVIIDSRDSLFEEHKIGFAEFLHKILNKSINSSILSPEEIKNKDFVPLKVKKL